MPRKAEPAYKTENNPFSKRLREIMKERSTTFGVHGIVNLNGGNVAHVRGNVCLDGWPDKPLISGEYRLHPPAIYISSSQVSDALPRQH